MWQEGHDNKQKDWVEQAYMEFIQNEYSDDMLFSLPALLWS